VIIKTYSSELRRELAFRDSSLDGKPGVFDSATFFQIRLCSRVKFLPGSAAGGTYRS